MRLRPLPYASLLELFGDRSPAERVAIYAITGGVPTYLEFFARAGRFVDALRDHCLAPGSIMLTKWGAGQVGRQLLSDLIARS
ncbi:MAG: hypothetical protein AB1791_15515 [Chloroflexota bacterium]